MSALSSSAESGIKLASESSSNRCSFFCNRKLRTLVIVSRFCKKVLQKSSYLRNCACFKLNHALQAFVRLIKIKTCLRQLLFIVCILFASGVSITCEPHCSTRYLHLKTSEEIVIEWRHLVATDHWSCILPIFLICHFDTCN